MRFAMVLCLAVVVGAAATSPAATSSSVVGATVLSATSMSTAGCATGVANVTDFGTITSAASYVTSADCTVVFGSSNDTSMLRVFQHDQRGAAMWKRSTGSLDDAFDGPSGTGDGNVETTTFATLDSALALDPSSRILITGYGTSAGIARLTPTGAFDTTFNTTGYTSIPTVTRLYAITAMSDGRPVAVGYGAGPKLVVTRMTTGGVLDVTFDGDSGSGDGLVTFAGTERGYCVAIDSQDRVLVVSAAGTTAKVRRLLPDGRLDTGFGTAGVATIADVSVDRFAYGFWGGCTIDASDRVLIAGSGGTPQHMSVARLTNAGVLDLTFDGDSGSGDGIVRVAGGAPDSLAWSVEVDRSGSIFLGGRDSGAGIRDAVVAKLSDTGVLDIAFDGPTGTGNGIVKYDWNESGGYSGVTSMRIIGDGTLMGLHLHYNASARMVADVFAMSTTTGSLDQAFAGDGTTAFVLGSDSIPTTLLLADDGSIIVGGGGSNAAFANSLQLVRYVGMTVADFDDDDVGADSNWTEGSNSFGACLRGVAGAGVTGAWTVDANADCTAANTDPWRSIPTSSGASGAKVAQSTTAGTTNATALLRFGFRTASAQAAGRYLAPLTFEVLAPNA